MAAQSPVPDDVRARLVVLLRMLRSEHVGERAAAGLQIDKIVLNYGIDWETELFKPAPVQAVTVVNTTAPRTWATCVEDLLGTHFGALRGDREITFLTDILSRGVALSVAQACWLCDLCDRAGIPLWDAGPPPPDKATRQARWQARRGGTP